MHNPSSSKHLSSELRSPCPYSAIIHAPKIGAYHNLHQIIVYNVYYSILSSSYYRGRVLLSIVEIKNGGVLPRGPPVRAETKARPNGFWVRRPGGVRVRPVLVGHPVLDVRGDRNVPIIK